MTWSKRGRLSVIVLTLAIVCLAFSGIAVADDWPQFHKDVAHTGYSTDKAPHILYDNEILWSSGDIGAVPSSSVAVAEGKVYVNCGDYIYCLYENDGTVKWSQPIVGSSVEGSWISPAYNDGKVFISGDEVYAFDAELGTPLWSYDLPSDACDGGPLIVNGKVYAGDWEGHHYFCLDADTTDPNGDMEWTYTVSGFAQGTPAYYDDGGEGRVYLTSYEYPGGHIYCVNAETGALVWQADRSLDMCGSPMVADGKVWVTTYNFYGDGEIMAFDVNDIGGDQVGDLVWGPISIKRTDSTPTYHDGKIYVCGGCYTYSNQQTYCIDVATENIDWQTIAASPGIGHWTCAPAVADGLVYVGMPSTEGGMEGFDYQAIYALDAATGSEVWHYDHGGASPSIVNGKVFTVGEGQVWAFGPDWDVNKDLAIDIFDLVKVALKLGEPDGTPGWIPEDVTFDADVDIFDMVRVSLHLGE